MGFESGWVINVRNPLDCHQIDYDNTKPIYLEHGKEYPTYDRDRMFDYRLSDKPSEEYIEKHPECLMGAGGQMTIFDF